ncbi:MAG: lysophospholipid acyltransferase family protein [Bacteroidia bacterium]|nr:lysophospholipid acyltransferase family protein [Bacteroidia bacterium]
MDAFGFYIFYGFSWLISLLPLRFLYFFSDILYIFSVYIIRYRKTTVYNNLKNSFPEKTEDEIGKIAREFFKHFCDSIVEDIKLLHISAKELDQRVQFNNIPLFDELYKKGKNIILVSGHYGNWTWMVRFPQKLKHKPTVLYKPFKNRYFDNFETRQREKYGAITIPTNAAYRKLISYQKNNELFLTWFLTDQCPPEPHPFWTSFLNQDTPVFLGAEKVAAKFNAAVVFMTMRKTKRGYYSVDFTLLCENAADLPYHSITEMHTRALEKTIVEKLPYWLWSHRRWKFKR